MLKKGLTVFLTIGVTALLFSCGGSGGGSGNEITFITNTKTFDGNFRCSAGIKDGSLYTMGNNRFGQLGDGTISTSPEFAPTDKDKNAPTRVGTDTDWAFVSTSTNNVYAIKTVGSLWGWGDNTNGYLGDDTIPLTTVQTTPNQIGTDNDWTSVSAHAFHALALKADGSLWGWGLNQNNEAGLNTPGNNNRILVPTRIGADNDWVSASAGYLFSVALKNDGTLWVWGDGANYGLGRGADLSDLSVPTQLGLDNDWVFATATDGQETTNGSVGVFAIKADGTLWTWGRNAHGELGDGTKNPITEPTQIGTATNWVMVDGGHDYSLGLNSAGEIYTWGSNTRGQLADGNPAIDSSNDVLTPTKVGTDTDWASISAGYQHGHAFKNNGSLYGWGFNFYGYLGDSSTTQRNAPVRINCVADWVCS